MLLAGALAIPFVFESPSMWYKFGLAKVGLRTGKILGMAAGLLLFLQLPLAGRLMTLDRIFSFFGLLRQHRIHAWAIAGMALAHPVCVLGAEGKFFIPLEMRYWPEWAGVGLLIAIVIQLVCSQWRQQMKLAYHIWLATHRTNGLLIVALLIVHVLYVSETFSEPGPPRLAIVIAAGGFALCWVWVRTGWLRAGHSPYRVSHIQSVGAESICVELTPLTDRPLDYVPGQFVFVSFRSANLLSEAHPFTLSSTPSRPETLQVTIRACGDWTRQADRLEAGDRALVQGPFGRFSHLFTRHDAELIMIAGGIGITPMISMLRYLADRVDPRPITLVWSNRSQRDVPFGAEMDVLATRLTGLRRVPIFTRNSDTGERSSRLDRTRLTELLRRNSRDSVIYLCGPAQMMSRVTADLKAIGFPGRSIMTERFGV